ncbi:MAG: hypothetical protein K9K66_11455 [Desulfarculaceae bacterium]|nr:hypothetical protein [Desulfarculaceae bacterium]MCF8070827.1 hypothetical protein [Desulfarculaceae bacterium]MCF8102264.1 hypothetical protein [Desulfarculaceae bacterium]MCF8117674.1 hypothetical protein [Desulfarculaceae bacterium]
MKPRDPQHRSANPLARLKAWEWWALGLILALCLGLALRALQTREPHPVEVFLERAQQIDEAARRFAADHNGAFPPDGIITRRPAGLSDRYIKWDDAWLIDFEAGPNGKGGHYVCLEFTAPRGRHEYRGLCAKPELRERHGQGQAIPGTENRIWVIEENARVMPQPPPKDS